MKPSLKILQLASFEGNIGDNANHIGTRRMLKENLEYDLTFTNLEIREFYWKKRQFDDSFVKLANQHDLVMIGGGNYFELWVPNSHTGTSININSNILKEIRTPVLFYSLGCDAGQGVPEENLLRFRGFLDYVLESPRFFVTVRNDGSHGTVERYLGNTYSSKIYRVPDGGFFTTVRDYYHPELPADSRHTLAINLAGDMLDVRFNNGTNSQKISYERFLESFGGFLNTSFNAIPNLHVVFIPHIFRDLNIISDVLGKTDDIYRRKQITVAPYLHGCGAQEYIFDLYKKCDLVLGTRFHANVCPIGLNTPTIGLVNYPQIQLLYEELGLTNRAVHIDQDGFEHALFDQIIASLQNRNELQEIYMDSFNKLKRDIRSSHSLINHWLKTVIS